MPGLGIKFKEETRKAAGRISEFPTAWSIERGEIRKWPCFHHRYSPSTSQTDILAGSVIVAVWFLQFICGNIPGIFNG
jgi:hypothetical protein